MPDPKTDVYGLAAVLHECLSGHKLPNGFEREPHFVPPSSFNVALSIELDTVLLRAVDPDRSKRFATAADFAKALKAATSAFMWKPAQRSEFVSQLFQTRKRREQVLAAGCEELVWKPTRIPTAPKLPVAVEPAKPRPTTSMRSPAPSKSVSTKPSKSKKKKQPARQSRVRVLSLALVACALGFVWERGLVEQWLNPPPPAMWALRAGAGLSHAPLQVPEEAASRAELSEEVAERTLEAVRTLYAVRPKLKAPARDPAPLAWSWRCVGPGS
jgi:hypothetical protein